MLNENHTKIDKLQMMLFVAMIICGANVASIFCLLVHAEIKLEKQTNKHYFNDTERRVFTFFSLNLMQIFLAKN